MYVRLFVCPIYLSIHSFISVCIHLFTFAPSTGLPSDGYAIGGSLGEGNQFVGCLFALSIYLSIHSSIYVCMYLFSFDPYVCIIVRLYLSIYLSIYLFILICMHSFIYIQVFPLTATPSAALSAKTTRTCASCSSI